LSALDQADKLEKVVQDQSIVFRIPPTAHSPSVEEIAGDFDRLCALDPTASSSAVLHRYEVQIQHILDFLARQDEKHIRDAEFGFRCAITRSQMEERQDRLRQLKSKAWEAQRQLVRSDKAQVVDTSEHIYSTCQSVFDSVS
jgi:hypothetical protein